jgi:hypothetical protein
MLLDFRKPKCVVLRIVTSTSGKYKLFYGHHYVQGKICYDVGTVNQHNGEIITRHYLDEGTGNPKAEALKTFHDYEKFLTRPARTEERDDNDARLADAFRRALTRPVAGDA